MENESKEGNTISDGTSLLATQNIIGAQKRQKKAPAPPVLQRIRPISKRKKFKKSLGPDFLEPAELGMQYLRDTYEPKCDICSLTMFSSSTSLYVSEELLHCNNCDAKAHPSCVNLNEEVAHKTQWQCHNCKICSVCRRNESNEYLIICITCSKGFHVKCHSTPIVDRPKGHWYCQNCCQTKGSTHSSQISNGANERKTVDTSEESSQSEDNESEFVPKLEKSFKLILETESNSEKEVNIEISSNDVKERESKLNEVSDGSDQNSKDCVSNNMQINSNGIDSTKEEVIEEELNNEKIIKNENNDSQNSDTNQSGTPPVSPQKWSVEEVETYIREAGFPSESIIFKEQEIDGRSLLLLRRMDVLTGLSLKLGPALKIYNHISRLQGRENNERSDSC